MKELELKKPITAHGETLSVLEFDEPTGKDVRELGYTPYPAVDLAQSNNASDATGPNPFMINKASAPKVDGEIKVSFINMPPGMRVTETRSSGIDINHDVGYTRFW
ncbi:phage tail assembly protein [Escherichia coli]|nr:phage tail assembly protein [Escherichia coli]